MRTQQGFTLIELSIVLVIIGLIVGGVLVGQHLIRAAEVRATLSQIEKYNQACNTFYGKYRALPGDMNASTATTFGFSSRGGGAGYGDGNGIIEGNQGGAGGECGTCQGAGETIMFWVDASKAGLVDGGFTQANMNTLSGTLITGPTVANYLPKAKLGGSSYIYVYSGGSFNSGSCVSASAWCSTGINYYGLAGVISIDGTDIGELNSVEQLSVQEAYKIDSKIDDGVPMSGNVTAQFVNGGGAQIFWAGTGGAQYGAAYSTPTAPSATSCFDNGNLNGAPQHYSVSFNNGNAGNCALSFKMQAGD